MRKIFLLIILINIPIAIFAADLPLSAGGGGFLGYTFTRYTLEGNDNTKQHVELTQNMDRINYGGFLFFDATYAVFKVMFQSANNSYAEIMTIAGEQIEKLKGTGSEMSINLSLSGKYPFFINEKFSWFPMLGLEYQIALKQMRQPDGDLEYDRTKGDLMSDLDKNLEPYPLSAWNAFIINIGAGLDFFLTNNLFLRGDFLFGFRLPTGYEKGALEYIKYNFPYVKNPKLGGINGTPTLNFALGYRF